MCLAAGQPRGPDLDPVVVLQPVHYSASPEDAQPWLAQHPGGELLPVGEASRLAADLTATMLDRLAAATPRIRDVDAVRHANLPRASSHPAATPQA